MLPTLRIFLREEAQPFNVNHCSVYFVILTSRLNELYEEVVSWWSALRSFKWQYSNFFTTPHYTDYSVINLSFANFSMLKGSNPYLCKHFGYTPKWYSGSIVSAPKKYWGDLFFKKSFVMADRETNLLGGNLWMDVLHGGTNNQIMLREEGVLKKNCQ